MEKVWNNKIRHITKMENTFVEVTEQTRFMWHGHLRRKNESRSFKPVTEIWSRVNKAEREDQNERDSLCIRGYELVCSSAMKH